MNTKPDDVTLALWLEDELQGEEFARVEAWAANQPEQLAAREETRHWRAKVAGTLPREIEPPYPDFFNSRIQSAIVAPRRPVAVAESGRQPWWRAAWFMPATAAAGMALAFWLGHRTADVAPVQTAAVPVIYTPDSEVQARYFAGTDGSSTVIVLEGVSAIPDAIDFRETAWTAPGREMDFTASVPEEVPTQVTQ